MKEESRDSIRDRTNIDKLVVSETCSFSKRGRSPHFAGFVVGTTGTCTPGRRGAGQLEVGAAHHYTKAGEVSWQLASNWETDFRRESGQGWGLQRQMGFLRSYEAHRSSGFQHQASEERKG